MSLRKIMSQRSTNINIAVLSIYSFPFGGAATNRILAYCKGLIANGVNVDIFIPHTTDYLPVKETLPDSGSYEGIRYFYSSGRYRSEYKVLRGLARATKFRQFYGYISSWKNICQQSKIKKYSCIIISTDLIPSLLIYSLLAKIINAKSIFIFDEYPIPIRHKLKKEIPSWKSFLYRIVLKNIDAYISISEELKNYFTNFSNKSNFVLPVIVDTSRFIANKNDNGSQAKKYLCYMGNMEITKDDVDNIIKAFAIINKKNPNHELHLYGMPSQKTIDYLKQLINELHLKDSVLLKGRVESYDVPQIISNAYILVNSQPDTVRAKGGFPTKLGEYLATGVPALFTDVGENAKHVHDEVHAFFVKPQDPIAYAEKIQYIIDNYSHALNVAKNGRNFILVNYSHTIQGKRLADFLNNLIQ